MDHQDAPRVLLGNLSPIMVIGMARVLTEDGADVIGQERHPSSIVTTAGRTQPDVVVLEIGSEESHELGARVQQVSSDTKVIFCDSDEGAIEVLDPGADEPRMVVVDALEGLRTELAMSRQRHQVKE